MKTNFLSLALMALGTCTAWAGSVCPGGSFPHNPDPTGTGCNVLITINADRTATVTLPDPTPYDGSEDVLIGVVNNSSGTVPSFTLAGTGIFGLEGDGICAFVFVGNGYCSGAVYLSDPGDYYGPNTTFTITNTNLGTVNFTAPIAASGTAFFSLEGVPSVNLTVTVAPPGGGTSAAVGAPTLSFWAILLLASMLMGYSLWVIRKNRQHQG